METLINFAATYTNAFLVLHLFAMVLGLGGATYCDILLMHFLKDLRISKKESEVIHTMTRIILIGIVLAFVSGFMLFIPKSQELLQTPKFLAKNIIFAVIVINGFVLHHVILPRLIHFSFHKDIRINKVLSLRHAGFISGAVSVVSWYSVFLLGGFKNIPFTFQELMLGYVGILIIAIIGSLVTERLIARSIKK